VIAQRQINDERLVVENEDRTTRKDVQVPKVQVDEGLLSSFLLSICEQAALFCPSKESFRILDKNDNRG
jgi:hypothetical protein